MKVKKGYTILFFILLSFFSRSVFGQSYSSEGKSFYISVVPNIVPLPNIEITLSSSKNTQVKLINSSAGLNTTVNLLANIPQSVTVAPNTCVPALNDIVRDEVIRITSDEPISVYIINSAAATSDGILAYPEKSYGSEYYIPSYEGISNAANSNFIVVATEDNTVVDITPTENTKGGHQSGVKYRVSLNKGECYMELGDGKEDLTGTYIKALNNKKIAVYGGTKCVNIPAGCFACDMLMEQVIPVSRLGKEYLLAPLSTGTHTPDYTYRIISTEDNNEIKVNNKFLKKLNKGEVYNEHDVSSSICISAKEPIMVIQYAQGIGCVGIGDPAMVIIPPVEQFIERVNYTTPSYSGFVTHHLYVLTEKNSTVNLNGIPIKANKYTPYTSCSDYKYVTIDLSSGKHTVESNDGFSMIAYGYGHAISYAYIGGASFKNLKFDIVTSEAKCDDLNFNFQNSGDTSEIISSMWDFGDSTKDTGKVVNKTFKKHGIYTITNILKINEDGVARYDTLIQTLRTKPLPVSNFATDNFTQCFNENYFEFRDSSEYYLGAKYKSNKWKLGENSPVFNNVKSIARKFNNPGKYNIKLIIESDDGCFDTIVKQITVTPSPKAKFEILDSAQCESGNFFNPQQLSSIDTPLTISNYSWDFGDNNTSNSLQPIKTYTDTGNYIIRLEAIASNGCIDTTYDTVTILPSPFPNFSVANICHFDTAKFHNLSTTKTKAPLSYKWNFGNGSLSNIESPTNFYKDSGTYTIGLVVENKFECKDSSYKTVNVYPKPTPSFAVTGSCVKNSITFNNASKLYGTQIKNAYWDLDDGKNNTSTTTLNETYTTYGNKNIKLIIEDVNTCRDSIEQQVYINPLPQTDFNINNGEQCFIGNAFKFDNTTTIADGDASQFSWYINNNLETTDKIGFSNSFTQTGSYAIKLIAKSDSGCVDSIQKTVTINPNIKIDVKVNKTAQCLDQNVFKIPNNSIVNGAGTITNYNWEFSDNTTEKTKTPQPKKFSSSGIYTVQGIMETNKGCLDTFSQTLTVWYSPRPSFETEDICYGDSAYFENLSPKDSIANWLWDFGDGTKSIKENPYRKYAATGNYEISLIATTNRGCRDTLIKYYPNLVKPQPKAYYSDTLIDSYERFTTIQFNNKSTLGTDYVWDFGDGTIDNVENPTKIYNEIGRFLVTLTASNQWGCEDKYEKKIYVVPTAYINIPNAFSPGNADTLNAYFKVEGIYFTKEIDMKIFNRWGTLIYHSNQVAPKWDGRYKGELVQDGVYLYAIRILDYKNKVHIYNGSVMVIK